MTLNHRHWTHITLWAMMAILQFACDRKQEMHFEFDRNVIMLKATINNDTLNFLLDSGVDPSVIDLKIAGEIGVGIDTSTFGAASGMGSGNVKVFPVTLPTIYLSSLRIDSLEGLAFDMSSLSEKLGKPIHGILGYSFLKDKTVKIDYELHKVIFYNSSEELESTLAREYFKTAFSFENDDNIPVVRDFVLNTRPFAASIDLGSGFGVQLYAHYLNRFGISRHDLVAGKGLVGARGHQATLTGQVDVFNIGSFIFSNEPIIVSSIRDTTQVRMGNVGNKFLSRFRVALDYPNQLIYFEQKE